MAKLEKIAAGNYRLNGDLDFSTVMGVLTQYINLSAQEKNIEVDLSGLQKCNSAALALFVEMKARARGRQQIIVFSNVPQQIQNLAAMSNVEGLLFAA